MKCSSCNAQVDAQAGVCPNCGHQLGPEMPKRTMMGLPSISADKDDAQHGDATQERDRSTLFGIPAVGGEEAEGLAESTSPASVDEDTLSEADDSTKVVSNLDLGQALGQDANQAQTSRRGEQETAFGLPSAKKDDEEGNVASAWGLAEESDSATQVVGAALADALLESEQGASGFSRSTGGSDSIRGTLMGMGREEMQSEESTREIGRNELDKIREEVARKKREKAQASSPAQATPEPEPQAPFEEDEDATQALGRDALAEFEERIQGDRRKQLLNKLRPKSNPKPGQSSVSLPYADSSSAPAPGAKGPSDSPQRKTRKPTGPRFSIPKPGNSSSRDLDVPEVAVEPLDEPGGSQEPKFGGGQTSFPIPSGTEPGEDATAERELSDAELALALEDTGVVAGDEVDGVVSGDDVESVGSAGGEGIHEFKDDDTAEPIFPIDHVQDSTGRQVDLNADFEPSIPAPTPNDSASVPQRSTVNIGKTPPSGTAVRPQQPQAQQPQAYPQGGHQQMLSQPAAGQPPVHQQDASSKQQNPAATLIKTVQAIFGVLGALFLVGAGIYGLISTAEGEMIQKVVAGTPTLAGVLTMLVALLPLSQGLKNGGFFAMGALAAGALSAGVIFSASMGVLLLVLGGLLLVLCAAAFPLVLKVVQ